MGKCGPRYWPVNKSFLVMILKPTFWYSVWIKKFHVHQAVFCVTQTLNMDKAEAAAAGFWSTWWNSSLHVISPSSAIAAFLVP